MPVSEVHFSPQGGAFQLGHAGTGNRTRVHGARLVADVATMRNVQKEKGMPTFIAIPFGPLSRVTSLTVAGRIGD